MHDFSDPGTLTGQADRGTPQQRRRMQTVQEILDWTYTPFGSGIAPDAPDVTGVDFASNEGATFSGTVATFTLGADGRASSVSLGGNMIFARLPGE